ncbi:MAG: GatB/YqeY domain-containing protein [Leptospiraceae bacterium]|nr:GatB/YqeY domain-containing protein [Leptospiraceae bacterium]MCB1317129.1 GatB/YqeY domain-containing protein [Leptospiraceae bacterium]MCB1320809.1 GatB/YqeY domain-containing protein [Leptospiraceae bacterium]
MGQLQDKIEADLRHALKNRLQQELATLRLLKSDLQYELTKDGSSEMDDEQVKVVLKRAVKKRRESIEQFEKAGKTEQAAQEQAELEIIERYLPAAVSAAEVERLVDEVCASVNPTGPSDMGKVMGAVMGKLKGQNVEGKLVKDLVQKKLQTL